MNLDDSTSSSMRRNLSGSSLSLASAVPTGHWIVLDVAGKDFKAKRTSLGREPASYLAKILEENVDEELVSEETEGRVEYDSTSNKWEVDSNPEYFEYILKYLRTGKFTNVSSSHSLEDLIVEAEHLKLQKLADICREHINPQRNMQQQQQQHDSFSSALPQVPPGFHPPGLSPVHFNISPINEASVQMQHQSISPSAGSPGPPPGFETVHLPQQSTLQPPKPEHAKTLPKLSEESLSMEEEQWVTGLSAFAMPTQQQPAANEADGTNKHTDMWQEEEEEDRQEFVSANEAFSEQDSMDFSQHAQHDVGSTTFEPPIKNTRLIDVDVERTSRAAVPVFELLDGRVHNFLAINAHRMAVTDKFLYDLCHSQRSFNTNILQIFGANIGDVVFYLQRLCLRYPDGCTVKQYVDYENFMKMARRTIDGKHIAVMVPTVVSLLQSSNFLTFGQNGNLFVSDEVAKTHLFMLRQNLCSNLYRFLYHRDEKKAVVKQVLDQMKEMVPSGMNIPGPQCLLSICNRYPAIFQLTCDAQNNYLFETSWISLNANILKEDLQWRVILDCDISNVDNDFCDCGQCIHMED